MANVFQRKDRGGAWFYRFMIDGKEHKARAVLANGQGAATEAEALDCAARERERIYRERAIANAPARRPDRRPGERMTLAQAFSAHMANVEKESSKKHIEALARHSKEALDFFGWNIAVTDCQQALVDEYRAQVVTRPRRVYVGGQHRLTAIDQADSKLWKTLERARSPSEQNHVLNALRSAFKVAYQTRDTVTGEPELPYPPTVRPVTIPKREPTPMRASELAQRYKHAPPWVRDAMDLARLFGLRLSEVLGVTVDMVDSDDRGLLLPARFVKGDRDQFAEGGPEGWKLLEQLVRQTRMRHTKHLVTWPGLSGWKALERGEPIPRETQWKPLGSIARSFKATAAAAGIRKPRRFHDLRSAYITEASAGTKSTFALKEVARHASIATTERYVKLDRSVVKSVIAKARKVSRHAR